MYHPCPAHHPLSENIELPEKRLEHRSIGKRRAKCFYTPSFVVEGVDIGDTGSTIVDLLGHEGQDGWLFPLNLISCLYLG